MQNATSKPIRVVVQQPCLTRYRVPVFRELARREGIDLTVAYGEEVGMTNAAPDGFKGEFVPLRDYEFRGSVLRWHDAQLRFATRRNADVVVLSWSTRYLTLLPALVRARWNNVGTVLWGHGYSKAETAIREQARLRVGNLADCLMFYNCTTAQQFVDGGWTSNERSFVALNSLDQAPIAAARDHWRSRPEALAAFQNEHGLQGRRVALYVSRLLAPNRTDLLISAIAKLRPTMPDAVAVLIGGGPEEARLKSLAGSLNLGDSVRFVGPVYDEMQLAPWFLSSRAFCYPANIGLSLLHAFGYGLPVITSDRIESQNPEIEALQDGVNGLLYQDGSVDHLADVLRKVLSSDEVATSLGSAALSTAHEQFTLARMVDGFEAAIRYSHALRRRIP